MTTTPINQQLPEKTAQLQSKVSELESKTSQVTKVQFQSTELAHKLAGQYPSMTALLESITTQFKTTPPGMEQLKKSEQEAKKILDKSASEIKMLESLLKDSDPNLLFSVLESDFQAVLDRKTEECLALKVKIEQLEKNITDTKNRRIKKEAYLKELESYLN